MPHTVKSYITKQFSNTLAYQKKKYEIIWFHGTRTDDIDSIDKNGLLQKQNQTDYHF